MFRWFSKYQQVKKAYRDANRAREAAERLLMERTSEFAKTRALYKDLVKKVEKQSAEKGRKLEKAENNLQSLVNSISDLVFYLDENGNLKYINDRSFEILGYYPDEIAGRNTREFISPEGRREFLRLLLTIRKYPDQERYVEFSLKCKDGNQVILGLKIRIDREADSIRGFNVVGRDITEQKRQAEQFEILYTRMQTLLANQEAAVLLEDENRHIVFVNQQFCQLFQIPVAPENLLGVDCSSSAEQSKGLFAEPDKFVRDIDHILAAQEKKMDEKLQMADGTILEREYIPIFIDNTYRGHLWQYKDITEKERINQRIKASEEKYRGIIEKMELGLLEVDQEQNITRAYDWFCDMVGYTEEELVGRNAVEIFISGNDEKKPILAENQKRLRGKPGVYEAQIRRKDGSKIWVLISGAPIYDAKGNTTGSIGIHYDITDQKNLQRELTRAKERAEEAQMVEKQFLAHMSHEIRNPINSILGMSNLLFDTPLNTQQTDYMETIKYSSQILLNLINDVLDINKIEAGQLVSEKHYLDLGEMIETMVKTFAFKHNNKNISVLAEIDPRYDYAVLADKAQLQQILMNLIGNAVKFTDEGSVKVDLDVLSNSGNTTNLRISVSDTGVGIPGDKLDEIFEKFKQADYQVKMKYGGTGLGLAITKKLVESMGGRINVSSELGKGTTFSIVLPFNKGKKEQIKRIATSNSGASFSLEKKILVVEDNPLNQKYLIGLLNKNRAAYEIANNGVEALELVREEQYSMILMDIRMPEMDGYETTIRIRNMQGNPNQQIPIIALTASALVDEKKKALAAGMTDHLSKPYTPEQLCSLINQYSNNEETSDSDLQGYEEIYLTELNVTYLENYYGHDTDYALKMFEVFREVYAEDQPKLEQALTAEEYPTFFKMVHKLKSNFSLVGLPQITGLFEEMESFKEDPDRDHQIIRKLYQHYCQEMVKFESIIDLQIEKLKQHVNTL